MATNLEKITITVGEAMQHEKFNNYLRGEIEQYYHRRKNRNLKRTPYESLDEKGLFNVDGLKREFIRIEAKKSTLPAAQREAVTSLIVYVAGMVANYIAEETRKAKEAKTK